MRQTLVTIQRPSGTAYAQHIGVQVDQVNLKESLPLREAFHYRSADLFKVYTLGWYPSAQIVRSDILIDERETDPETGTAYKYRVVARPKTFEYSHQEVYCEVVIGT